MKTNTLLAYVYHFESGNYKCVILIILYPKGYMYINIVEHQNSSAQHEYNKTVQWLSLHALAYIGYAASYT